MAVELRCPDCRSTLRLKSAPEPGTEVECPDCGAVFDAPEPDAEDRPKKKKPAADEDRPKKKPAAEDKPKPAEAKKPAEADKQPKKRKAKKKETNKGALVAIIGGVVVFLVVLVGVLVWFFTRKPASFEMMGYLPDDCVTATGLNIGHMSKYTEFIKAVEPNYANTGLKQAADALSQAAGGKTNDLIDLMVQGTSPTGAGIVLRMKQKIDPGVLAKLPGARQASLDGQTYFTAAGISQLWGGQDVRVFAPTDRLVVFCPPPVGPGEATFRKMLVGNRDNFDTTLVGRFGPLAKRTMRGTYWHISTTRVAAPDDKAKDTTQGAFKRQAADATKSIQGWGFKASLGSRAVRFEVILAFKESETADEWYRKFKDSPLSKGDDEEPPKFWKDFAQNNVSNKKVSTELLSHIGAKASGNLFILYSECDTKTLMEVIASIAGKLAGQGQGQDTPAAGGAGPGPAGMPAGPGPMPPR